MNRTLLVVDDEESILHALIRLFHGRGYTLLTANSGAAALRLLAANDVHVILSDQRMPEMTGVELLEQAKLRYPDAVRIVLSGYSDVAAISDAVNKGNIYKFLFKPWDNDLLLASVGEAFERFELERTGAQFARIYQNTAEGIVITGPDGRIQAINPAFSTITGYAADEVAGKTPALLKSGRHDAAFFAAMWAALLDHGRWTGEIWNKRKNGEVYPEWLNISAIRDADGRIAQFVGLFSDITEHRRNEERLRHEACHDTLTGLPNRMLLAESLDLSLRQGERLGQLTAVLLIELDSLASAGDGDERGESLVTAAERLKGTLRKGDTLARIDGGVFAVVLPLLDDVNDVARVIGKITAGFARPSDAGGRPWNRTVSIGVSICPQDGNAPDDLVDRATQALDAARAAGGNTYMFYSPALTERARARVVVESELGQALAGGEIEVHYQPRLRLRDGAIVGVEALARWNHPAHGLLLPEAFLGVAEDSGQVIELGRMVLAEACRQVAGWRRKAFGDLRLSVNLSPAQFRHAGLYETVEGALAQSGLEPHALELDLGESLVMQGNDDDTERLLMLKRLGVELAADNFGTGYSSLRQMRRLPIDAVKIDRYFIRDVTTDAHSAALVRTIVGVAHEFRLEVCAVGVETQAQADFLREHGCDTIQGRWLAMPLPATEFEAFAAARPGAP